MVLICLETLERFEGSLEMEVTYMCVRKRQIAAKEA